ncbi:hypothetical protein ACQ4PT_052627 [Festuca glaucescens]
MATSERGADKAKDATSLRAARAKLEEQLGKLDSTNEEATPLVVDDQEEETKQKWLLAMRKKCMDLYDIQYEQVPHFCFSCGRFGHADPFCPTPGTRDANGVLPFGKGLRAPDEWKRTPFSESLSGGQSFSKNNKAETRGSSNVAEAGTEAASPLKNNNSAKRKANTQTKVYRRVEVPLLENGQTNNGGDGKGMVLFVDPSKNVLNSELEDGRDGGPDPKKKRPTPTSSETSAAAAMQPCPEK